MLRQAEVAFEPLEYDYEPRGGAAHAAEALGVPLHEVVKTLVFRGDDGGRMLVLMHGDREVSTKALARTLGLRSVASCSPEEALRVTGYQVGGISPFGTREALRVFVEQSIFELPWIYINAGKRGLLVRLESRSLRILPDLELVSVGR